MRNLVFIICLIAFYACGPKKEAPKVVNWSTEQSTELNKNLTIEEEIQIKLYLEQHRDWKMEKSNTGLRYFIYQKSDKQAIKVGDLVQVELKIELLDGKIVYETKENEFVEFKVDKSDVESGINEGIKLMKLGEKAKLIIPSHIAQGLVGDLDKVPPLSVLVVDIEIIGLK